MIVSRIYHEYLRSLKYTNELCTSEGDALITVVSEVGSRIVVVAMNYIEEGCSRSR